MNEENDEYSQHVSKRNTQRNNILAAKILAETLKTTLGPKGMDKMLLDSAGNITITNDGVTILEEMEIEHPAAKMLVEVSKTQEKEVGDGTTTVVMIAGKLLENAEKLLDLKIHPTIITQGYRLAQKKAIEILESLTVDISTEEELMQVAKTAMTGKSAEYLKEKFSSIILQAVTLLNQGKNFDITNIRIEKQKGESIEETELVQGIILDKGRVSIDMPKEINNVKIALIEEALELRSLENTSKISIASPDQLQNFISQEDIILKNKVEKIKKTGANLILCQKGIDESVQFYLAKAGIYAIRRVPKSDMQAVSKATNAKIVARLDDLDLESLGSAQKVFEKRINEDEFTYIVGCENPQNLTILIKGSSDHILDEVQRAIEDALGDVASILKDSKVVAGGGAIEIELSRKLKEFAKTLNGREQLAVEIFAESLEFIPITLAENAGLDPIDILTELKVAHESNNPNFGLNLFNNKIEDMFKQGIIEPLKVKTQAIGSASEVAIMILRIDDLIAAKKRKGNNLNNSNSMLDYD